ncbi:MarR family winged helix-turn-helix transcriptional regulator [Kiloniella antarctica]|uniref:MarR family winged helix-turn-helix transcriptional regulator n=1 Tax=Kiloniella antarctica TaxID=1550907 RepID=A0ABW5BM13_9PROT
MREQSQDQLSSIALTIFALNGQFLKIAEKLSQPAGLTATRWQVLGAVLNEPLTQAEIARRMGITRQSVRRTSAQLVDDKMACFIPNPSHRTAQLLQPTEIGYSAIKKINPQHADFAKKLERELGTEKLEAYTKALLNLQEALDTLAPSSTDI